MRHNSNIVLILNRSRQRNSSRPDSRHPLLKRTVGPLAIRGLVAVRGKIDISRLKLQQPFYCAVNLVYAVSF